MQTNTNTIPMTPLGNTIAEVMHLVQRRQELERKLRRARGEERVSLGKKLAHVTRLIRVCFR